MREIVVTTSRLEGTLAQAVRARVAVLQEVPPHVAVVEGTPEAIATLGNLDGVLVGADAVAVSPRLDWAGRLAVDAWIASRRERPAREREGEGWGT